MKKLHNTLIKIKASLLFFTLLCVFVLLSNTSRAQSFVWEKSLSGTGTLDKVTDIVTDQNANSYVLGYSNQQIMLNGVTYGSTLTGNYFPYVIKYDKTGLVKWVHVPTGLPAAFNITTCSITLDTSGSIIYSGITQAASGASVTFAPRSFNEATLTYGAGTEGFIVALDSSGTAKWVDRIGNCASATVNWIALAHNKFDNTVIFGVSAATTSSPISDLIFYDSPYFGTNENLGNATTTGTQESWYGKLAPGRGGNVNQNYRFGSNQYSQEWIEDIATDSLGNVYFGCTFNTSSANGYTADFVANGSTHSISGGTQYNPLIVKLSFDLQYLASYRNISGQDSKLKNIAVRPNGEVAYIFNFNPGGIYSRVQIGGMNTTLSSAWLNTVQSTGLPSSVSYSYSAKGIAYDDNGNIWAGVGGTGSSTYAWDYSPAFATASIGALTTNPGIMLLKLNHSSGTSASWLDYRYIRESINNTNSEGNVVHPGNLSISGNHIFLAGSYSNSLTASPLPAMSTPATDFNGYVIKLGCEPAFTLQPQNANACSSSTIVLATTVSDPSATFQWMKNGVAIGGATNDTLTLTNVSITDTGTYVLTATNSCGKTVSDPAVIGYGLPIISGLQAWYKFDNNAADSSGNGNHGTLSGAPGTTDRFNHTNAALDFGTNNYVNIPASLYTNPANKTVTMWIKKHAANSHGCLFYMGGASPPAAPPSTSHPMIYIGQDNKLRGVIYTGNANQNASTFAIADTAWHMIALVTGTNIQTLYYDGIQASTLTGTFTISGITNLLIGAGRNYGWASASPTNVWDYFDGKIDDVRFYNSGLSVTQLNQLYTQEIGITTQPLSQAVCASNPVTFSITASGTVTYQWKKGNTNIGGATSASYTDANVQASDTGSYTCVITNACTGRSETSNVAILSIGTGGNITSQPGNQTPCLGAAASFTVAISSGSATYQWQRNGINIAGATSATYNISAAAITDTGTYTCVITTACGLLYSNGATLTIPTATSITTQPQATVVCVGNFADFTVVAGGTGPFTYVWKKGTIVIPDGGTISGATTADLHISSTGANDPGNYSVTITGACGTVISNSVSLSFGLLATITTQPAVLTQVCEGNSAASLTVVANANGLPLTYQWRHYSNNVLGATSATLTFPNITLADSGKYTCVITSNCGSVTSNLANVRVYPRTTITQEPVTQAACTGSAVSLTTTAAGQALIYQWKKNGINISGATSATYNIASAAAADSGHYVCFVSGTCGSDTSVIAALTVNPGPAITQQPQAQTICAGAALNLSVIVTGSGLTYQWQKGGVNISGETTATFTRANAAVSDSGSYVCVITSGCGNLNSQAAHVTVNPIPTASISPSTAAVCAGSSIALTASGGGTYAWSNSLGSNATVSPSPSSATTYTVTVTLNNCTATASKLVSVNALPAITLTPGSSTICSGGSQLLTAGGGTSYIWSNSLGTGGSKTVSPLSQTTYTVSGTDINNCSATASATVTVNPITAISTEPIAQTTCVGGAVNFTVVANGAGLSYQWRKAGANINGATSATYTIASAVSGDAGNYDVIVSGTCGRDTSVAVALAVTGSLQISQQPLAVSSCGGSNAILTVVANGSGIAYSWSHNGTAIGSSNNDTLYLNNLSANDAGNYICNITSNCGNATSNTVAVTVKAKTFGNISQSICYGDTYTFHGQTLTQSGAYRDTLVNTAGCDSILTLNFTVRLRVNSTQSAVICNGSSITFDGQTITAAGQYFDTLTSASGCDSFITMNVTVALATSSAFSYAACGSFSFGGVTLTTGGTYVDTISNVAGCDSVITLTLTINTATASSIADTICNGAFYNFGTLTLTASGTYTNTITNSAGCDSVITLNLYVRPALSVSVTQSGLDLTATAGYTTYQWELNSTDITGANANLYSASANGDYTVVVTDANNCSATSSAVNVTGVGIKDINTTSISFSLYPNPANDVLNIRCDDKLVSVEISDMLGKSVKTLRGDIRQMNIAEIASGVYTTKLITEDGKVAVKKFTKQ